MKNFILFGLILLTFSCNGNKKESQNEQSTTEIKAEEIQEKVLDSIPLPPFSSWTHNNVVTSADAGNGLIKLIRSDASIAGYSSINNINVYAGSKYRVSILVKKGDRGDQFGLRLSSKYPNRADAVFDLDQGTVVGTHSEGEFEKETASIEMVGDGWYKCSLSSELFSNKLFIFLGSTNSNKRVSHWEGKGGEKYASDIYVNISSILLEEVSL